MATLADAIREFASSQVRPVSSEEVRKYIDTQYPGVWKPSSVSAHLYACVVNNPKAYVHHPSAQKFLYKFPDGTFSLFNERDHGPNEWGPVAGSDGEGDIDELVEASVSLERDIEDYLCGQLESIEQGLTFKERQVSTDVGRIDILATDKTGDIVVIELKVGEAKDSVVGQIARYMGWMNKNQQKSVRGIIVASSFPEGIRYAASAVPNLSLYAYKINFTFEDKSLSD